MLRGGADVALDVRDHGIAAVAVQVALQTAEGITDDVAMMQSRTKFGAVTQLQPDLVQQVNIFGP